MEIDVKMYSFLAISRKIRPYLEDHINSFKKNDNMWKTQCSVKIKFRPFRDKDSNFVWKTQISPKIKFRQLKDKSSNFFFDYVNRLHHICQKKTLK